jgi:hypothetical protein
MALMYFPNGTAGAIFQEQYCDKCINFRERPWRREAGAGCPIWDLHLLLDQYRCCNEKPSFDRKATGAQVTKAVLDFLIDENQDPMCSMFIPGLRVIPGGDDGEQKEAKKPGKEVDQGSDQAARGVQGQGQEGGHEHVSLRKKGYAPWLKGLGSHQASG